MVFGVPMGLAMVCQRDLLCNGKTSSEHQKHAFRRRVCAIQDFEDFSRRYIKHNASLMLNI